MTSLEEREAAPQLDSAYEWTDGKRQPKKLSPASFPVRFFLTRNAMSKFITIHPENSDRAFAAIMASGIRAKIVGGGPGEVVIGVPDVCFTEAVRIVSQIKWLIPSPVPHGT